MTPQEICDSTQDAYSYDRYGKQAWLEAIKALLSIKYSESEVIWILRSKYVRWAADAFANQHDETDVCTGREIMEYRAEWGINVGDAT
jgi:hypothetical protein